MSDKIKIGEGEHAWPLRLTDDGWSEVITDADGDDIVLSDMLLALNELASLRQEVERLRGLEAELKSFHNVFDKWWGYYTDQPSGKRQEGWGWIDEAWDRIKAIIQRNKEVAGDTE